MSRLNTAGKNNKVHFHIHNLHAAPRPKFMNKIYSRMYRIFLLVFKHTETPRLIQMKTAYTLDSPKKKKLVHKVSYWHKASQKHTITWPEGSGMSELGRHFQYSFSTLNIIPCQKRVYIKDHWKKYSKFRSANIKGGIRSYKLTSRVNNSLTHTLQLKAHHTYKTWNSTNTQLSHFMPLFAEEFREQKLFKSVCC